MKYSICILLLNIVFLEDIKSEVEGLFSYIGNWPINSDKDSIIKNSNTNKLTCPNGLGCTCEKNDDCINSSCTKHLRGDSLCSLRAGDTFPHFKAVDQFNEIVDIYDFANDEGKYILLEMGAVWCSPCNSLASWFTWNEDEIKNKPFWKNGYEIIYDLVKNKDVYFISVLYEDEFRDTATYDTAYAKVSGYFSKKISPGGFLQN